MTTTTPNNRFKALDACHRQMQKHLTEMAALLTWLRAGDNDPALRQQAGEIEAFFSSTARAHHAEEEQKVFPGLLLSDNAELVQAVRTLQQDHNWIELNWLELAPMLRALAQGEDWVEPTELEHALEVFVTLCNDHIALEESLIYPEAKARLAAELASRATRMAA